MVDSIGFVIVIVIGIGIGIGIVAKTNRSNGYRLPRSEQDKFYYYSYS